MPNFKEILRPILKKFYVIIWRLSYWSIFRPRTKSRLLVLKERVIILAIFITWNIFQNCDVRSDICSYVVSTTPLQLNCKIQSSANISWSWEYVNPSAYFGQRKYGNIFCFNWYSVLKVTSGNARGTTSHMDGKCPTNIECFQMAVIALDICVLGGWCSWWKTIPRSGTKNSKSPPFSFPLPLPSANMRGEGWMWEGHCRSGGAAFFLFYWHHQDRIMATTLIFNFIRLAR